VEAGLAGAAKKIEAEYEVPFLATPRWNPELHRACSRDRCDVWAPTQNQTNTQALAAKITSGSQSRLRPHDIPRRRIRAPLRDRFCRRSGGNFKMIGGPVKVTWFAEDDIQHDYYRTASHAHFHAGLDADGWPVVWMNRIACPSLMARFGPLKDNFDRRSVEICDSVPYAIPNILVDYQLTDTASP